MSSVPELEWGVVERGTKQYRRLDDDHVDQPTAEERLRREQRVLLELLDLHEQERRLVAYEIHDGFAQLAAGAAMQFNAFRAFEQDASAKAAQAFNEGVRLLGESVEEARRLISGLRSPVLDSAGVVAAIRDFLDPIVQHTNVEIQFAENLGAMRLAPILETAVFRIVQESVTNARKHSRSDRIRVMLKSTSDSLKVEIQDWGRGFQSSEISRSSFGLEGIQQRARLLGGRVRINTSPGEGTRVRVVFPLMMPARTDAWEP